MKVTTQGSGTQIKFTNAEVKNLRDAADVLRELETRCKGAPQDAYQALCSLSSLLERVDKKGHLAGGVA